MSIKNLFNVSSGANNNFSSSDLYNLRNEYKESILSNKVFPYQIDLWYDRPFYGRLDEKNNSVMVVEGYLKNIDTNIKVLDFVADAFLDMKKYNEVLAFNQSIRPGRTKFGTIQPFSGYKSPYLDYDEYMNNLFKSFFDGIKDNELKSVISFEQFIQIFLRFLTTVSRNYAFTRSGYLSSSRNSIEHSGLSITLAINEDYSDDTNKIKNFVEDPGFDRFADVTKRYGFLIDKNAPWRIVADLTSPAMKKYLLKYSLTTVQKVFDTKFYKAYYTDIDLLKFYTRQFWNSIVSFRSVVTIPEVICGKTKSFSYERKQIGNSQLEERYDDAFFNRLYIFLRGLETHSDWSQQQFENHVRNANELMKYKSKQASLDYMNSLVNGYENMILKTNRLTELEKNSTTLEHLASRPYINFNF